jgi:hypothetical protein
MEGWASLSSEDDEARLDGEIPGDSSVFYAAFGRVCPLLYSTINLMTRTAKWTAPTEHGNNDAYWRYNAERGTRDGTVVGYYAGPEYPGMCVFSHAQVKSKLQSFAVSEERALADRTPGYLGYTQCAERPCVVPCRA